ncbi:MAG: hypothetical protein IPH13_13995 [Planctomycetes bacterium]|nr:hypothetical protein [Planctomycetota bacterium]MCC7168864.1 hypothetical protein [Planctomycetota bacterium]
MAASKRKTAPAAIEEIDEEETGNDKGSLETGIVLVTAIALVFGIVLGLLELGKHYGVGPFKG